MSCTREPAPIPMDLTIVSADESFVWDRIWYPSMGVSVLDLVADVRNVVLGTSAAMAIKPAVQLAAVRTDRPDAGAAISVGSVITGNGLTHFAETLSAATKFYFRLGWSFRLTAGSFARCETLLYPAFRSCAEVFPAREIVFQPVNDTAAVSYFPITGVFATVNVDKAKLALVCLDNLNTGLEWRLAGRAFNDPKARGSWVDLQAGWNGTTAGDLIANTDEVSLSGLSITSYHWMELALALRKASDGAANSRAIFHVVPAVKFG